MSEKKTQHIQIPHDLGENKLTNLDYFIYGQLKRYMDWKTCETFVSQATLAEDANCSKPTVLASLKRLNEAGEIVFIKGDRGKSNHYIIKKDTRNFEMISYELLISEILHPELKGFYYRYQGEFVKDSLGSARCTRTNEELAKKFNMSPNTFKKYIKELEKLGVLSTALTKMRDETTGLMRDIKTLNLNSVFQAVLYTHEKVAAVEQDTINIRKDLDALKREIRELKKERYTTPTEFEMI